MHRLLQSAAGGLVVLAGSLALSAPAIADDYVVWSCHDGTGASVGTADWAPAPGVADACATATGGLRAAAASQSGGATTGSALTIPAGVAVRSARVWLTAHTSATGALADQRAGLLSDDTLLAGCESGNDACTRGDDAEPLADGNAVEVGAPSELTLGVACVGLASCGSGDVTLYRARFVVGDTVAPTVGTLGGTAVAAGSRSGSVGLAADTADAGGGVAKRELLVDGKVVATSESGGTCTPPFSRLAPCPAGLAASFTIDTTTLADGAHVVGIRATDVAGLATERTATIQVSNAPAAGGAGGGSGGGGAAAGAGAGAGAGAAVGVVPVARIALPRRIDLPHKGTILGKLVAADGSPVAGRRVTLATKGIGQPDQRLLPAGTVVSRADGTFPIGTAGESRVVRAYADKAAQDVILVRPLRVQAQGPKGTVPYRSAFALTGRLDGAGAASAGKLVQVQAFAGKRWRTVSQVVATTAGTLRWNYRLRNTARPSDYRFRFVVRRVASQPWSTARSRPVVVRVRPR